MVATAYECDNDLLAIQAVLTAVPGEIGTSHGIEISTKGSDYAVVVVWR